MTNKNWIRSIVIGFALTAAMTVSSFAGQWVLDDEGWWYQNDDGTYPASEWKWIDGNVDGTAECYYFSSDGYMAYDNEIDGYRVNRDGQWEVNGVVQKRGFSASVSGMSSAAEAAAAAYKNVLLNKTWNSRGVEARQFALADINNDGIMEISVVSDEGWDDMVNSFLYYNSAGLQKEEFGEIDYVESADPERSIVFVERTRGKAVTAAYAYDPSSGLTLLDTWFLGDGKAEEEAKYEKYGKGKRLLSYVDATYDNIDYYLSGSGKSTGLESPEDTEQKED
ncbi:MAG: hypothetical protein IJT43_09145 [Stomatobaculum sp.]|nr:hypothetical protein [Stomatobaculum sp.]